MRDGTPISRGQESGTELRGVMLFAEQTHNVNSMQRSLTKRNVWAYYSFTLGFTVKKKKKCGHEIVGIFGEKR